LKRGGSEAKHAKGICELQAGVTRKPEEKGALGKFRGPLKDYTKINLEGIVCGLSYLAQSRV
jgi:hypothetical protein